MDSVVGGSTVVEDKAMILVRWQLREGILTLLSAMFQENYQWIARYSSKLHCTVSGASCFSADLPQGQLEVPSA